MKALMPLKLLSASHLLMAPHCREMVQQTLKPEAQVPEEEPPLAVHSSVV